MTPRCPFLNGLRWASRSGIALFISTASSLAQDPALPAGGGQSNEERLQAAHEMVIQMGVRLGLNEAELRAATPAERALMLEKAGEAAQQRMERSLEERFGRSFEELDALPEGEKQRLLEVEKTPPRTASAYSTAPRTGAFPDGSVPIEIGDDLDAEIAFGERLDHPVILVIADLRRREIVFRDDVVAPFRKRLELAAFGSDSSELVIEVIDPANRQVIRRYRPVAKR